MVKQLLVIGALQVAHLIVGKVAHFEIGANSIRALPWNWTSLAQRDDFWCGNTQTVVRCASSLWDLFFA